MRARARIAVYESPVAAPRLEEVGGCGVGEFIELLSTRTWELVKGLGGSIPFSVIHELVENLIHADFEEPVVSILEGGAVLRISDQGPGLRDRSRALLPGFTTATSEMKRFIRGVGSGLPLVKEFLDVSGGSLVIEDNIGSGSVVTVTVRPERTPVDRPDRADGHQPETRPASPSLPIRLSTRQKRVLALVMEAGSAGPSLVKRELSVGLSTAHRDLASLEEMGLLSTSEAGKREITPEGRRYLESLLGG